nr:MAG TPA: hypothetical protein [Bacteriophage sp.]
MNDEVKEEIITVLELLKTSLVRNHVGIGISGRKILFFDVNHYKKTKKFNGFEIPIDDLVK